MSNTPMTVEEAIDEFKQQADADEYMLAQMEYMCLTEDASTRKRARAIRTLLAAYEASQIRIRSVESELSILRGERKTFVFEQEAARQQLAEADELITTVIGWDECEVDGAELGAAIKKYRDATGKSVIPAVAPVYADGTNVDLIQGDSPKNPPSFERPICTHDWQSTGRIKTSMPPYDVQRCSKCGIYREVLRDVAPVEREEIDMCHACEKVAAEKWLDDKHLCEHCFSVISRFPKRAADPIDTGTGVPDKICSLEMRSLVDAFELSMIAANRSWERRSALIEAIAALEHRLARANQDRIDLNNILSEAAKLKDIVDLQLSAAEADTKRIDRILVEGWLDDDSGGAVDTREEMDAFMDARRNRNDRQVDEELPPVECPDCGAMVPQRGVVHFCDLASRSEGSRNG